MNKQRTCFLSILLVCLVLFPLKLMAIEMGTITLEVGESYTIDGEAGGATSQSGNWSVDGDAIFSITAKSQTQCTVRAYKAGTSKLKYSFSYTDRNYNYKSGIAYWTIRVEAATVYVTSITLNTTSTTVGVGDTQQLTATIYPSDATNKNVTWSSSDTNVASISSSGLVTGKTDGTATVTCKANDGSGVKATCAVTVIKTVPVTEITLNQSNAALSKGDSLQLTASVKPSDASNKSISWSSSNEKIVFVNATGMVKALAYGDAVITCLANDGSGISSTCSITVEKPDNWVNIGNYSISWFSKNKTEFTLSTAKELAGMTYLVNNGYTDFAGKTIVLDTDIDLSGKDWTPCNLFRGTFDGAGHAINGINIDWEQAANGEKDTLFVGFWRKTYKAEIRNVIMRGALSVHLSNKYKNGSNGFCIGGMVGNNLLSTLENCTSDIDLHIYTAHTSSGLNSGAIGGLCGMNGDYYGVYKAGGNIRHCRNIGNIAFISESLPRVLHLGGLIGRSTSGMIEYSENRASSFILSKESPIYSSDNHYIGGIVGYDASVNSGYGSNVLCCRNLMDSIVVKTEIKGAEYCIGGIDGWCYKSGEETIKNCYNSIGRIKTVEGSSGKLYYGGIISRTSDYNSNGPTACFSNNDILLETDMTISRVHDGSTSFSSEQMKTSAFLEELNMYSMLEMDGPVWTQPAEGGYPYIAALYEPTAVKPIVLTESKATTIYSLSGQRLAAPKKGINIVGGRKVVVK